MYLELLQYFIQNHNISAGAFNWEFASTVRSQSWLLLFMVKKNGTKQKASKLKLSEFLNPQSAHYSEIFQF